MTMPSYQPRLVECSLYERGEQRVRLERPRLQLGVELDADEPRVVADLDDLGQHPVGRHAGKPQPGPFERIAICDVNLVTMAMPLTDVGLAVDPCHLACWVEH